MKINELYGSMPNRDERYLGKNEKITESDDDSIKQLQAEIKQKYPQISQLYLLQRGDDIKIDTIIIDKKHRGSGIGSEVLQILKDYAKRNNKRLILTAGQKDPHLGTTSFNRLDRFYRKNGFTRNAGRNKDFSIMATHYYDARKK